MNRTGPQFSDVFLSHSAAEAALAGAVREKMSEADLTVFTAPGMGHGDRWAAAVREGVQHSLVFVVLLSRAYAREPGLFIEVGAAWGWETPVYLLLGDIPPAEIPEFLRRYPAYPLWDGLPELIAAIPRRTAALSGAERKALAECYAALETPADRLLRTPPAAQRLARLFREKTGASVPPAQLIRELLRLRKRGQLPRLVDRTAG